MIALTCTKLPWASALLDFSYFLLKIRFEGPKTGKCRVINELKLPAQNAMCAQRRKALEAVAGSLFRGPHPEVGPTACK